MNQLRSKSEKRGVVFTIEDHTLTKGNDSNEKQIFKESSAKYRDVVKYLESQDNKTTVSDESDKSLNWFSRCCQKYKERHCDVFTVIDRVISFILHIPCMLFASTDEFQGKRCLSQMKCPACCRSNNVYSVEDNHSIHDDDDLKVKSNVPVVEFCNFQNFWGPKDICRCTEDEVLYKKKVKAALCECNFNDSAKLFEKQDFIKELQHVATNTYINRLKACIDLIIEEGLHSNANVISCILNIMKNIVHMKKCETLRCLLFDDNTSNKLGIEILSVVMMDKDISPIHMLIINKRKILLNHIISTIQNDEATYKLLNKASQNKSMKEHFPSAELPLNLAVWIGDEEMVTKLVLHGAEMSAQDSQGNNCFHVVSLLAKESPVSGLKIFHLLMQLVPTWIEKTARCTSLRLMTENTKQITALSILFKSKNKNNLTPLTLSAAVGSGQLINEIMSIPNLYKHSCSKMGTKSTAYYDISEVDPLMMKSLKTPSVLELLVFRYDDNALQVLHHPVIGKLSQVKGRIYSMYMVIAAILHISIMVTYNITAYVYIFPYLLNNVTTDIVTEVVQKFETNELNMTDQEIVFIHKKRFEIQWVDWFALVVGFLYFLYFCVCVTAIHKISRRCNLSGINEVWTYNSLQIQTILLFAVAIWVYFYMKVNENKQEALALSISMLIGWTHCIMFTRAFRSTGFFTIMIHRILFSDVLRFLFIISIIALSFTMAIMVIYATEHNYESSGNEFYQKPYYIMFDFFRLAMGIADYTRLLHSKSILISNLIYICFVIFCNILLFNLLIAAMNRSYGKIGNNDELHWKRVRLADMVILEWIAPCYLKRKSMSHYKRQHLRLVLDGQTKFEFEQYLLEAADCKADIT